MHYPSLGLYIDGHWLSGDRDKLDVIDPATEMVLGQLPIATPDDVHAAIQAADRSFPAWRLTPAIERARILRDAALLIRSRAKTIAAIITQELGKPLAQSEREVVTAAEMFEWAAEEARRTYGRIIPARSAGVKQMMTLEPLGPMAAFSGWNAPAITPARKISGALAAGCTLVIKPSEETPATAIQIARALEDAGLPPGVLNLVFGDPGSISRQLLESPTIRGVTFTGATSVGRSIAEIAARTLKRTTLELGGHAPVLVFPDADLNSAVSILAAAKFRNTGQICVSPTRFYVHSDVYEPFLEKFVEKVKQLSVGNGMDDGIGMGPLANPRRIEAMQRLTEDARQKGARILHGGKRIGNSGWFWEPTVIADFDNSMEAASVEPFGPMALMRPFSTFEEAVEQANRLPFGLAAYVFSQSNKTIARSCDEIESGVVCINNCQASFPETPFGGVKDSGLGREGGLEGLHEFMQVKYLSHS